MLINGILEGLNEGLILKHRAKMGNIVREGNMVKLLKSLQSQGKSSWSQRRLGLPAGFEVTLRFNESLWTIKVLFFCQR